MQQPGEKPGTAVALRSGKGTGKSLFATWFTEIFGDHAITMAQANQFVGQFNAHYERAIFAVAEESFWAGSKEAEGALKHLITGETHRIERKGVDSIEVPNFTRVLILGNNEWMVPASEDERRYFVLDVNEVRKQDAEYFIPLIKQARNGGVAAMLYDLLRFDFSKVDLRNPPKTTALRKQLYESMDQERRWWFDVLESGEFVDADGNSTEWPEDNDLEIRRQIVFQSYKDAVGRFAGRNPTPTRVGRFLRKCLPGYDLEGARESSEGRHRQYTLPSLSIARKLYNERTGLPVQAEHAGTQAETALFSLAAAIDRDYAMSLFDGNTYEPTAEDFAEPG